MTDESEVSCYLCFTSDEYGSMIKVSIIPPGRAPRPQVVICRSCAAEVARELWSVLEGENSPSAIEPQGGADNPGTSRLPFPAADEVKEESLEEVVERLPESLAKGDSE